MKQRQTLQNYKTSSTRHIFQAKIKYYTILETSEAVLFDEMMKSKKILHMCSQNGVVTLVWLTLYNSYFPFFRVKGWNQWRFISERSLWRRREDEGLVESALSRSQISWPFSKDFWLQRIYTYYACWLCEISFKDFHVI